MAVKCGYCKKTGQDMAHVKACAATAVKTLPTLDEILGDDVNPDPKAELDKWQAAEQAKIAQFNADLAKVEVGTIVEETPAPAKKEPFIPAHRVAKMKLAAAQAAIPFNPAGAAQTTQVVAVAQSIAAGTAAAAIVAPAPVVKTGQELELGMYQVKHEDGTVTIYKVKWNKSQTYKLAERLWITEKSVWDNETNGWKSVPKGKFHYATGMMAKLTSDNKMSEADAKAFHDMTKLKYGVDYGFCCVCGKLLTVKKSIEAGIGPVCGKNL